jgi:hypothetical protein
MTKGKFVINNKPMAITLLAAAMALAGCATPQSRTPTVDNASTLNEAQKQREMVVEDYVNTNRRLQAVASRVVVSGADMCGEKVRPYFGFTTWNDDAFKDDWKRAAQSKYNLSGQLQIAYVAPGSAADAAGLQVGDIIQAANGQLTPYGKNASTEFGTRLKEIGKSGSPVEFTIRRGASESKVTLAPTKACDFNVRLSPDDVKNAYADGQNVVLFKGMMDFFKSDEEVALVFSHELAHNSMKHIDAKKKNATIGSVFGLVLDVAAAFGGVNTNGNFSKLGGGLGGGAHSVAFEQEADYVGLYFMAQSGYRIDDAPNFWRRMATSNSSSISIKSSHPTAPERFLALEATVKEINSKISRGQPLRPEMKEQAAVKESSNKSFGN